MQVSSSQINTLETAPLEPSFLKCFADLYAALEPISLNPQANEFITSVAWNFVIFSHAVSNASFKQGLVYLQRVNVYLDRFINELNDHDREIGIKLKKFTQNLQKQYYDFLVKKTAK